MSAFDKIIGYEDIKNELIQVCDLIKNREIYEKLGAKPPKGILLDGDPGLGKTMMAKAFIEESGLPSYIIRRNKGGEGFVDEITNTFAEAVKHAPSIILLDDMDKFANDDDCHQDAEEYVAIQASMDDAKEAEVYVVATVNNSHKLPRSLVRSGRFDIRIDVECPCDAEAEAIIRHYLADKKLADDVNFHDIARMMSYSSCAELETILNKAALTAGFHRKKAVDMEEIVNAVLSMTYNSPNNLTQVSEDKLRRTALHEAGHLVIHEVLQPGSVGLASIRTNGSNDVGGFVHMCEKPERRPYAILTALGGKAAVELYYCDAVASGCGNDINKAYRQIRDGITSGGTNGLSYIAYVDEYGSEEISRGKMEDIEQAVTTELERYSYRARDILLKNRDFLDKVTEALVRKHTLLASDIQAIKSQVVITPVEV